ncbi:hypothetical protein IWX87_003061 [Polaromonas sp. CG_9.7]|nr:hypothetical protein [Polaromonas sp. CG_9.7]MBG6115372.1 hypothetical protein [Polaromonas sp. CG_9.2]MDH6182922.1 hypothetical protein [Polaromonas sp. CG_23.6]
MVLLMDSAYEGKAARSLAWAMGFVPVTRTNLPRHQP